MSAHTAMVKARAAEVLAEELTREAARSTGSFSHSPVVRRAAMRLSSEMTSLDAARLLVDEVAAEVEADVLRPS